MEQRITMITLGVKDLAKSTAFFEKLGWKRSVRAAPGVAFFQCGGIALGLYPLSELAKDAEIEPSQGHTGNFAIAHNARSKEEVDSLMHEAEAAGANIIKPPKQAFWGGYSGYFTDPDGHLWELAWNPGFELDEEGGVTLPD